MQESAHFAFISFSAIGIPLLIICISLFLIALTKNAVLSTNTFPAKFFAMITLPSMIFKMAELGIQIALFAVFLEKDPATVSNYYLVTGSLTFTLDILLFMSYVFFILPTFIFAFRAIVSNADQAQVISDRAVKIMNTSSIVAPVIMSVFGFAAIIYHALSLNVLRNEDSRATHSKVSAVLGITYATSLVIFVAILSVCVIYNMLQMTREMEGKNDDQSDQIRASNTKYQYMFLIFAVFTCLIPSLRITLPLEIADGVRIIMLNIIFFVLYSYISVLLILQSREAYAKFGDGVTVQPDAYQKKRVDDRYNTVYGNL